MRGRIAATRRHHPETDLTELKREHAAAKIAAYVEKTVAEAPPLTDEQRDRLATLLRGDAA
nr:hypothetical protein [Dermacoccus nishinomiyaensis]